MKEQEHNNRGIRFYWQYFWKRMVFAWQIETAYAHNTISQLVSTSIYNITFVIFLYVLLGKIKTMAGYTLDDMLFLAFITQVVFYTGISFVVESVTSFTNYVKNGSFDLLLLKPMSVIFQIVTLGLRPFTGAFFSIPPLSFYVIVLWSRGNIHFNVNNLLMGSLSLVVGFTFWTVYRYTVSMLVFKLTQVKNVLKFIDFFSDFGSYPYEAYHGMFKTALLLLVPTLVGGAIPASYFLGKSTDLVPFVTQCVLLVIFTLTGLSLWRSGLKNYESASS